MIYLNYFAIKSQILHTYKCYKVVKQCTNKTSGKMTTRHGKNLKLPKTDYCSSAL